MRRLLVFPLAIVFGGCADGVSTSPASTPTPTATPTSTPTPGPTGTATPSPAGCLSGPLSAGDHTVSCDGFDYDIRVPATCPFAGKCGLILDVHGRTMSAEMEEANTLLRERGEANGFVVIQPNANPDPPSSSWSAADHPKVHAFVVEAIADLGVDPDRVHVTGFSQGGYMTFAFVCRWPEIVASAAPGAAAGADCFEQGGTPPSTRVPLLQIHGASDALVPINSGIAVRDRIRSAWGLDGGTVVDSGTGFTRTRYTNANGDVLEWLRHEYSSSQFVLGGHCYPGSNDPGGADGQLFSFACEPPNAFTYGEEVMEFFLAHPRAR